MNVNDRAMRWMMGDDTGLSSKAICAHMLGIAGGNDWPHDPDDLGRCLRLLALIPEWKFRIGEMASHGRYWVALAERWDEIAQSMADEVGIDWSKGRSAPNTYALMRSILDPLYRHDSSVIHFGVSA